ncbi:ubiquinol-cytochrome c reductase iron-sulfur subunit [Nitriliruptor alkaliphilus]|uniref:QcrA and Rieske domain-containing protein n=1 Tax=Nitriliruptor alkaliphilus TaxID=427918 RepID=UPI000698F19A|nr:Rieske 2Fe-2S domain-containing protein [Nitriliruptor alkaliphilus]
MADDAKSTRRLDLPRVERRAFLRYGMFGAVSAGLGGFGLASLGFLYPRPGDELTGQVPLEDAEQLAAEIQSTRTPVRVPAGGISIVTWDPSNETAMNLYGEDHAIVNGSVGLMALNSQQCVHLGCAVPWCQTSQWFECPCHGSRYNRWGEYTGGPAPRGLDRYSSFVDEGTGMFVVDLGDMITGPARTANALEQPQEGPNCVDA